MKPLRAAVAVLGLAAAAGTSGCFMMRRPATTGIEVPSSTAPLPPVPVPQATPDATPKAEPKSRYGNPPYYDVFGKRYYVLSSSVAYVERGVASWYGPGFHKVKTSNGEMYDMYGMSAAHKTLPLPAYVRVTNLQNGRSVVVRVNDRGPFVGNRIIDLSYTAAVKLDMLRNGTAMVEVRSLDTGIPSRDQSPLSAGAAIAPIGGHAGAAMPGSTSPAASAPMAAAAADTQAAGATSVQLVSASEVSAAPAATPGAATPGVATPGVAPGNAAALAGVTAATPTAIAAGKPLFVQAGAFADPANAERLAATLRSGSYGRIFVRGDVIAGRKMYRVRIGPVANVQEFDRIYAALERDGVHDAHLALD